MGDNQTFGSQTAVRPGVKFSFSFFVSVCRTNPNLNDLTLAFQDLGIRIHELEDYIHQVEQSASKYIAPEISISSQRSLLAFEEDGQYPILVKPTQIDTPVANVDIKQEETG